MKLDREYDFPKKMSLIKTVSISPAFQPPTREAIDGLFHLIRTGNIRPLYAKVYGLNEITEAHSLLEKGGAGGKIILKLC